MRVLAVLLAVSQTCPVQSALAQEAPPATQPPPGYRVVLTYYFKEKRAPLRIELFRGIVLFKAKLADRDVWMMLDNGADHSVIDLSLIEPLGIKTRPGAGKPIRTPTGTVPYSVALDVPLVIPGQLEGRVPMAAIDLKGFANAVGHPIDAVLGADILNASVLGLDVGRGTLELLPAGVKVNMPVQPIALAKGKAQFEVTADGKPLQMTIDLGFTGEMSLSPEAWARVGQPNAKKEARMAAHVEAQVYSVDHSSLPAVEIGTVERKDVGVDIQPIPVRDGDGWIGTGLLSQFVMLMDMVGGKLWLIPRLPSTPASSSAKPASAISSAPETPQR